MILMLCLTSLVFALPNVFGEEKPLVPGEGTTVAAADQEEEERPTVSAGLTIPFWKYFTAVPMIAYSFPLGNAADNMLKATSLSNDASHFFGGVTLSMAF